MEKASGDNCIAHKMYKCQYRVINLTATCNMDIVGNIHLYTYIGTETVLGGLGLMKWMKEWKVEFSQQ